MDYYKLDSLAKGVVRLEFAATPGNPKWRSRIGTGHSGSKGPMNFDKNNRAVVLAVASGKGGVGKTNISTNLAICLAGAHKRVTLLDADLGLGNLDVVMNVNSRYNLSHVIAGQKTLEEIAHIGPAGVEIICGGSGLEQMANLTPFQQQRLLNELEQLQRRCDVIVIDTGAGISNNVVGFCMASDHTLVVTTPEPTAMTDAYAIIKVLAGRDYKGKISLLVNMAKSLEEGRKIHRQIAQVADRFLKYPVYEAGTLCRDEALPAAVRRREPVVMAYPYCSFSNGLAAIGARLTDEVHYEDPKEGFFRKVVNWFF